MLPESMHIPDCSNDSVEVGCGGSADVSQSTYKGRRVAVKVVHVNVSNLDVVFSVSLLLAPLHPSGGMRFRDSAGKESPGSIFGTRISYHFSG